MEITSSGIRLSCSDARVVSDKKLTSLFCLYTSYDGGTNIFKDQLFELDPDGKWLPK